MQTSGRRVTIALSAMPHVKSFSATFSRLRPFHNRVRDQFGPQETNLGLMPWTTRLYSPRVSSVLDQPQFRRGTIALRCLTFPPDFTAPGYTTVTSITLCASTSSLFEVRFDLWIRTNLN